MNIPFFRFCSGAMRAGLLACGGGWGLGVLAQPPAAAPVQVDLSRFDAAKGARVEQREQRLHLTWPAGGGSEAELVLNLEPAPARPLFERMALGGRAVLERVEPVTLLTIGERDLRAPSGWVAFFDNPPLRAHRTVTSVLKKTDVRVSSIGSRTIVSVGNLSAESFRGRLEVTLFRNSPLIFVEAVLSTEEDGRAILYDAGLVAPGQGGPSAPWADPKALTYSPLVPGPAWQSMVWVDPKGRRQQVRAELNVVMEGLKVSGRTLAVENPGGAVAVFPPPHQYFYPLDSTNNLGFVWHGAGRNPLLNGYGFGIRQPPEGDRIWVPWVNAPPRTEQRLGAFYVLGASADEALARAAAFTRGDRYARLPGYRTFTSHYHIEHALEVAKARVDQQVAGVPAGFERPGFVETFKARGVDIVHLAEFHVGAMPRLPARERLSLLKLLHEECARLSDRDLLILPGEEPNAHLGGHWISFFPRPVYWVLNRAAGEPFEEEVPGYGRVYRVGSADDVLQLMERERGLMWTAHPRIKGSRGFPDAYWQAPFFRSDRFLGGAWKAMPADLSQPRLGRRVLDLMDDMANAGLRKFALGEADMFRMDPDAETYAHLNVNYVQLDAVPRFADGWLPLLEALRAGRFFTTTGEVLVTGWKAGDATSGGTLRAPGAGTTVEFDLAWTFPLAFAEVISGDGQTVHRHRIDLDETEAFGRGTWRVPVDLRDRTWVRLEVWDAARNGAFTPPVWIER